MGFMKPETPPGTPQQSSVTVLPSEPPPAQAPQGTRPKRKSQQQPTFLGTGGGAPSAGQTAGGKTLLGQ